MALAAVLSIGAWGGASATEATGWTDLRINGGRLAIRLANGDVECASNNGRDCLWGVSAASVSSYSPMVPVACGAHHKALYGTDGYGESGSWCAVGQSRLFAEWRLGAAPSPAPTPLFYSTNPDGDVQCLSFDGKTCQWNRTTLTAYDFAKISPLTCGAMHQALYGGTGDADPDHWCSVIRRDLVRYRGILPIDPEENALGAITVGRDGVLFGLDRLSNTILRKPLRNGEPVTWFAGKPDAAGGYMDGPADVAQFNRPTAIARDTQGNLYIADTGNNAIRKVTPEGIVTTLAEGHSWNRPRGIAVRSNGDVLVADTGNNAIRRIAPDGTVSTLAGSGYQGFRDAFGSAAAFNRPTALALDRRGNLHVVDTFNHMIRKITPDGLVTTLAGTVQPGNRDGRGPGASFRFVPGDFVGDLTDGGGDAMFPGIGMAFDNHGNLLVLDAGTAPARTLRIVTQAGDVTTSDAQLPTTNATSLAVDPDSNLVIGSLDPQPLLALVPALP